MSSAALSDALHARVQAYIHASLRGEACESFDVLALALARYQREHIPAINRLCRARKVELDTAASAAVIPAVPCDVFRLARVAAHPPSEDLAVFRTSGTSQGPTVRGEHAFRSTATYELAALSFAESLLFPDTRRLHAIILAPPHREQADSSLGFMLDRFTSVLEGPASFHMRAGELDLEGIAAEAAAARRAQAPAIVLGTSFAFVHLLDASGRLDLRLPPGSRAMQTGGFKGRSREVAQDELRRAIARAFALPEDFVVSEYGMTELSSQLYEGTLAAHVDERRAPARHGVYVAPPWMRVTAVDPISLAPLPMGDVGLGRIVDLANVDSSVAIQTADRVRVLDEGIELLGRAPGAPPRGCSIAIDEMLSAS